MSDKEKQREYNREYYKQNAEKISQRHAAWQKANWEKVNEYRRDYEKRDYVKAKNEHISPNGENEIPKRYESTKGGERR